MNNELINRTSRAIASCKDDAPILKAVLIDCKTEMLATDLKLLSAEAKIKQLESELQKAREYVPFDMDEIDNVIINHAPLYRSDIDWFKAIEQAFIQRAGLIVKDKE